MAATSLSHPRLRPETGERAAARRLRPQDGAQAQAQGNATPPLAPHPNEEPRVRRPDQRAERQRRRREAGAYAMVADTVTDPAQVTAPPSRHAAEAPALGHEAPPPAPEVPRPAPVADGPTGLAGAALSERLLAAVTHQLARYLGPEAPPVTAAEARDRVLSVTVHQRLDLLTELEPVALDARALERPRVQLHETAAAAERAALAEADQALARQRPRLAAQSLLRPDAAADDDRRRLWSSPQIHAAVTPCHGCQGRSTITRTAPQTLSAAAGLQRAANDRGSGSPCPHCDGAGIEGHGLRVHLQTLRESRVILPDGLPEEFVEMLSDRAFLVANASAVIPVAAPPVGASGASHQWQVRLPMRVQRYALGDAAGDGLWGQSAVVGTQGRLIHHDRVLDDWLAPDLAVLDERLGGRRRAVAVRQSLRWLQEIPLGRATLMELAEPDPRRPAALLRQSAGMLGVGCLEAMIGLARTAWRRLAPQMARLPAQVTAAGLVLAGVALALSRVERDLAIPDLAVREVYLESSLAAMLLVGAGLAALHQAATRAWLAIRMRRHVFVWRWTWSVGLASWMLSAAVALAPPLAAGVGVIALARDATPVALPISDPLGAEEAAIVPDYADLLAPIPSIPQPPQKPPHKPAAGAH